MIKIPIKQETSEGVMFSSLVMQLYALGNQGGSGFRHQMSLSSCGEEISIIHRVVISGSNGFDEQLWLHMKG